jgi:hypothetical protein
MAASEVILEGVAFEYVHQLAHVIPWWDLHVKVNMIPVHPDRCEVPIRVALAYFVSFPHMPKGRYHLAIFISTLFSWGFSVDTSADRYLALLLESGL